MTIQNLYYFVDQLGFEIVTILFAITMTAVLFGLMSKSFLYD